ncbi:unnamed protein product [Camellia sinensis]
MELKRRIQGWFKYQERQALVVLAFPELNRSDMVGFRQRWVEEVGLQMTIQGVDFSGDGWVSFGSDLLLDLDDGGGRVFWWWWWRQWIARVKGDDNCCGGGTACGDVMVCGGLIYSNSMTVYVLTNLVTFLTHFWKLKLKHAVAIMNIKGGAAGIIGLVEAALIDAYFGHAGMLLITSVLYSIGLGLLVMSVPDRFFSKGVKSCPAGEKLCSSKLTASPFYWGLALIVLAKAGQGICLRALTFGKIKFKRGPPETKVIKFGFLKFEVRRRNVQGKRKRQKNIIRNTCNIVGTAGGITWLFVSSIFAPDWSHRFLISALVMAIGIAIFLIGYAFLSPPQLRASPLTNMLRVLLAAFLKRHLDSTKQGTEFNYGNEDQTPQGQGHNQKTPRGPKKRTTLTDHCRWLNNAAINVPGNFHCFPIGWINCTVGEVEETKLLLRMVPISATFLLYGVIKSNSNTFFIAQGYAMNRSFRFILRKKQHQIQLPIQILRLMAGFATSAVKPLYRIVFEQRIERMNGRYSSGMKVGLGMLAALVCCKVAWLVEYIRLKSLKEHGLLGHPDAIAPISVFWLSPQFVLMGIMDGLARDGMEDFFKYQVPESMRKRYALVLTEAVIGWGKILNIGFIMILDVAVEKLRVEDGSWIADTVNQSRLDLFYAALVVVSIANLFIFAYVASFYTYRDFPEEEDDEEEDPHEEIKTGKKQDKVEPTPDEETEPTPDEETERTIRTT